MTTYTQTSWSKKTCHKGNSKIYTEPNGGTLYIGGWNMDATFNWNTHVIDLTGSEHKYWDIPYAYDAESQKFLQFTGNSYAGWLSLPFPDFSTPPHITTRAQWEGIANNIRNLLKSGRDVLVACHGGHGRSGLFCSIVGYILAVNTDRSWASPVEKIRKIHCQDAVETLSQERFVYAVLGLNIQITRSYEVAKNPKAYAFENCPICGIQTMYVGQYGMCLGCKAKYETQAPARADLTVADIQHKGMVDHACSNDKCVGIWKAQKCGHVVHDQIVYDGWCQHCWDEFADDTAYAEKKLSEHPELDAVELQPCAICQRESGYGARYGVCYDCQKDVVEAEQADFVHNTITDPYKAVPHYCDSVACVGIVIADQCKHVVHNLEVEDGLCPECLMEKMKRGNPRGMEVQ